MSLAVGLTGCVEDLPVVTRTPPVIPLDSPVVALESECVPTNGATVASVSPEGDLWLAARGASGTGLTVHAADGSVTTYDEPRQILGAVAWSDDELTFVADDGVFVRSGAFVDSLPWPSDATGLRDLCGDPRLDRDGFMIADDLYQRSGGEWWRWRPTMSELGDIHGVARNLGACRGVWGESWVVTGAGLWRIGDLALERVEGLPRVSDAAFGGGFGAAALTEEGLFLGPEDWRYTAFEAGEPTAIAAAASRLYVVAGGRVYRVTETVEELRFDGASAVTALHPYASGLWVEAGGEVCRVPEEEGAVQVRGLRPWVRRGIDPLMLEVVAPAGQLRILRDGAMVHESGSFAGTAAVQGLAAGEAGWHTLTVEAGEPGREARRELRYEVVRASGATYDTDIAPLFEAHCAGSECHGADRDDAMRPDLSTYAGWVESADAIRSRVGATGDMPPFDTRLESWDSEEATLIVSWIDEGMVRGE